MGPRELESDLEQWCSLQRRLNPLKKLAENSGDFKIVTNGVEGPAHRTELALRQTTEENEVTAESKSEKGPYVELEDKAE